MGDAMKFSGLMVAAAVVLLSAGGARAACTADAIAQTCVGASGNPGQAGDDLEMDVPSGTAFVAKSTGGAGNITDNSAGGKGGDIDLTIKNGTSVSGYVNVDSSGGEAFGDAGKGGTVELTMEAGSSVNSVTVSSAGGTGSGNGRAGDGGAITASIAGTVVTDALIGSFGGNIWEDASDAGDSGKVVVTVTSTGKMNDLYVEAAGGETFQGAPIGDAGAIEVTIAGQVNNASISSTGASDATVSVVLQDGAVVTGEIKVAGNNLSTLTFDMRMTNRTEYNAALAVLLDPTKPAGGEIIVNGQSYAWSGFDQLVNMLDYVNTTQPTAPVQVTVTRGINKAPPPAAAFKCDKAAVYPVVQADGSIALYANAGGAKGKSLIGLVKDGKFRSSGLDFSVVVVGDTYTVKNAGGSVVSTCK